MMNSLQTWIMLQNSGSRRKEKKEIEPNPEELHSNAKQNDSAVKGDYKEKNALANLGSGGKCRKKIQKTENTDKEKVSDNGCDEKKQQRTVQTRSKSTTLYQYYKNDVLPETDKTNKMKNKAKEIIQTLMENVVGQQPPDESFKFTKTIIGAGSVATKTNISGNDFDFNVRLQVQEIKTITEGFIYEACSDEKVNSNWLYTQSFFVSLLIQLFIASPFIHSSDSFEKSYNYTRYKN